MRVSTIRHTLMMAVYVTAAVVGFAMAATGGDDESPPVEHEIEIRNFSYNPDPIMVKLGDTITWTNRDIVPHTATISATDVGTGEILLSDNRSMTMQERGTLTYHCRYHANMRGEIQVE